MLKMISDLIRGLLEGLCVTLEHGTVEIWVSGVKLGE
jgi:hypothetical protein